MSSEVYSMSAKHLVEYFRIKYVLYNIGFPGCMCFQYVYTMEKEEWVGPGLFSVTVCLWKRRQSCLSVIKATPVAHRFISACCPSVFERSLSRAQQTLPLQVRHLFLFPKSATLLTVVPHAADGRRVYHSLKANSRSSDPFPFERRRRVVATQICWSCWGWQCGTVLKPTQGTLFGCSRLPGFLAGQTCAHPAAPAPGAGLTPIQTSGTGPVSGEVRTAVSVNNSF